MKDYAKLEDLTFSVEGRRIGTGCPAFIVAELSGNHGGSIEHAINIIRLAKAAGADAVKFQTYTADTITLRCQSSDFQLPLSSPWSSHNTLWDLYNLAHTPWEWHARLFAEARKIGLVAFSSAFDSSSVDFLETLETPLYKVASPEITNIPLLEHIAKTRKPVIISTGLAESDDIELALATLRSNGCTEIAVLKCTSAYPTPPSDVNLKTIPDIASRFRVVSGLSDHSIGTAVAVASVALGAAIVEKHFKGDSEEDTVDGFFSSDYREFSKMVEDIRVVEEAMGDVTYSITPHAVENLRGRSSLYIAKDIKKGEIFTAENVRAVRPAFGLHPKHFKDIVGRAASCDLSMGSRLTWEAVQ